jgi:hypothetical protein
VDGVDLAGESCVRPLGQDYCRIRGEKVLTGLDATTIAWGIRCPTTSAPFCSHGGTLHEVWALVLGASVTLEDPQRPTVATPVADAFASGSWTRGAASVTFDASDNTGIRRRRVVEGSTTWASRTAPGAAAGGCGDGSGDAYTHLQPCAGARGLNGTQTLTVPDVCVFGDGVHELRVTAEDTGGGEARSAPFSARVDCTAPQVVVAAGPSPRLEGEVLAPEVRASDAAAGVASTVRQLSVDGGPWEAAPAGVVGEAGRTYTFRARAVDRAGNASGWVESAPVSFVAAQPQPQSERQPQPSAPAGDGAGGSTPRAEPALRPAPAEALAAPVATLPAAGGRPGTRRARLMIRRVHVRSGLATVEGTAPGGYTGAVRVIVRFTARGRSGAARATTTAAAGRWRARVRFPRRASIRRVEAATPRGVVLAARPRARPRQRR